MKRRGWKYVALAVSGGVLFQAAGCSSYLIDTLINNVLPLVLSELLSAATQGAA